MNEFGGVSQLTRSRTNNINLMEYFYIRLFNILNIKWTHHFLQKTIDESSYKRSFFGISSILTKYGIDNTCVRYNDKADLSELDCPFIVIYGQRFAIVEAIQDGYVSLYIVNDGKQKIEKDEFIRNWNGVALKIKATPDSGEPNYPENHKKEQADSFKKIVLSICSLSFIVLSLIASSSTIRAYWWFAVAINVMGLAVSFLLFQKELHIKNHFSDKLCGVVSEGHGCDNVINSAKSSLFGLVKLSEVGCSFFLVNLVTLLFFSEAISYVAIISVLVLPFTFWSVWFQKYRAKQWCALCLMTLVLMWAQALTYTISGVLTEAFRNLLVIVSSDYIDGINLVLGYIIVCLILNSLMAFFKRYRLYKIYYTEYFNLKLDEKVVKAFENVAQKFDTSTETASTMIFGNPDARTKITILSNPYCGPCAKVHESLKHTPSDDVSVQYILSYFTEGNSVINKYLIAAYQQLGPEQAWQIMTKWYNGGKKRGVSFFDEFGLDIERDEVQAEFAKHYKWRQDDRLYGTPTVIVNGLEVSYPYSVDDYMYL